MADETVGPRDRFPQPGWCVDGGGHADGAVYVYGPASAPVRLCRTHLVGRIKRGTWPDPPRNLRG